MENIWNEALRMRLEYIQKLRMGDFSNDILIQEFLSELEEIISWSI